MQDNIGIIHFIGIVWRLRKINLQADWKMLLLKDGALLISFLKSLLIKLLLILAQDGLGWHVKEMMLLFWTHQTQEILLHPIISHYWQLIYGNILIISIIEMKEKNMFSISIKLLIGNLFKVTLMLIK